ncbi:MAG: DNA-processing protein DprA [Eubacterium sp.]|nr:DNA-processing protein DprA [Eubacterium sp.]
MEEKYALWLSCAKGSTPRVRRLLLDVCGNAQEVYELAERQLEKIPGLMHKDIAGIIQSKKAWDLDRAWQEMTAAGVRFVSRERTEYPQQLKQLSDAPYGIFYRGMLPAAQQFRVAIVGARMCSEYGRTIARELARELAVHDVAVVSGMARGIDAAGHRGALDSGGETYAVLGCGVDICYPNYHRQLYDEIAHHGGLLSEYLPGTKPLPAYFPRRNRLISVLSDVVVVIEAKGKSGSLITADFALEQGRDVYALPGRITDALSCGCNRLIAQGAGVILSVEDCLAQLSIEAVRKKETTAGSGVQRGRLPVDTAQKGMSSDSGLKTGNCEKFDNLHKFSLEKDELLVYGCLGLLPTGLEELIEKTGFDVPTLSQILAALLQKHRIEEVFINHYKIITE